MNTGPLRLFSIAVFFLGVIIGIALSAIILWNRVEATRYYFTGAKYDQFHGLQCPVMIGPTEQAVVTAVFNNPTNEEDNYFYRAEISGKAFSTRQVEDKIMVPPHQTKTVQLAVDANDVDLMFFILVKMSILPNSVHRSQEAVCGIMIINILGLTGAQIFGTALSLSFLGIALGLGVWQQTGTKTDQDIRRATQTLGLAVLLTMFAASMGWWIVGMALSAITILLLVISLRLAIE